MSHSDSAQMRAAGSTGRLVAPGRLWLATALAIAVGACLPGSAAAHTRARGCAHARTPIWRATRAQLQRAVVCLVNVQRRSRGLPALRESPRLNRSAQSWTNVMVQLRSFSHGSDFGARISGAGFNWSSIGENIATGFSTPASVVAAWMASTGHCQNILSPTWRYMGVGVDDRAIPGYSARPGTWTQDFGLWMGQAPASGDWGPADRCPY